MLRKHFTSIPIALQSLRANPFHAILSMLGIVIGVGALVSILSLGDGMEKFGRDQLLTTTSLQTIQITSKTQEIVDGIFMKREAYPVITPQKFIELEEAFQNQAQLNLLVAQNKRIQKDTIQAGTVMLATSPNFFTINDLEVATGKKLDSNDFTHQQKVAVISASLAKRFKVVGEAPQLIGQTLVLDGDTLTIKGVLPAKENDRNAIIVPLTLLDENILQNNPPELTAHIEKIEQVAPLKQKLEKWLQNEIPHGKEGFTIITNDFRLEQVNKGIFFFKLVMGLITGISVFVGGIGVMNVLLISIKERTKEIGIRKATGAKRRDIVIQFLMEALVTSTIGCFVGLLFGWVFMAIAVPIIKYYSEIPLQYAMSLSTVVIILLIAFFVGLVFGTYPAWRASKLSPVDAIRQE